METEIWREMAAQSAQPRNLENSIAYLCARLAPALKRGDRVLICFPEHEIGSLGWLMEQAVVRCGGVPVIWDADRRWKTLLRQAFFSRAVMIIGSPLLVLGLSKLKRQNGVPLNIRRAILAGYPIRGWMTEGITKELDCVVDGCFSVGTSGIVAGFSCACGNVHLREDVYGVEIVNAEGNPAADGESGEIVLYPKEQPEFRLSLGDTARLTAAPCPCGSPIPYLSDIRLGKEKMDPDLAKLGRELQRWTSVLDCRLKKGEYGLEIELVVFAGEKLPNLPPCAKLAVRRWNSNHDEPLQYLPELKKSDNSSESH